MTPMMCLCGHEEEEHGRIVGLGEPDMDWGCSSCKCPSFRPAHGPIHHHFDTA